MKRLTKKLPNGTYTSLTPLTNNGSSRAWLFQLGKKLGQLEDIEDELGIDLITLFKAIKDGAILILDDGLSYTDWIDFDIRKKTFKGKVSDHEVFIKDYGKTWALTKEELEK